MTLNSAEYSFSINNSCTASYGIAIQTINIGSYNFIGALDTSNKTLSLFFSSYTCIPERESKRFIIKIRTAETILESTIQFTKEIGSCTFFGIQAPFSIGVFLDHYLPINFRIPYVGIYNAGVTCYMASALQFLSVVTPFLSLIFQQDPSNKICHELQNVFRQLQNAFGPLQIRNFISSFGEHSFEMSYREQDSHEFILTLFDYLDKEIGKDFEKARNEIFGIELVRIIESKAVNVKKETKEFQNDIPLPIAHFNSIHQSLDSLTEDESFEGDNKWDTGTEHGKQDAIRRLRFKKLPPFLIFNLCRYEYDERRQSSYEVRTRFECPEFIDMKPYCLDDVDFETNYQMVAVIAHRGSPVSGHYIAFTQPKIDGNWYKFDDSSVSNSSLSNVQDVFGGADNTFTKAWSFISGGNFLAYVVGYVRKDCIDQFKNSPDIPISISQSLSNYYQCRIIYDDQIEGAKIYGFGISYNWRDQKMTFNEIFKLNRNDENGKELFDVFVSLPNSDRLYGPIDGDSPASIYTIRGYEMNFIGIKRRENAPRIQDPIFFIADTEYVGVFEKNEVFEKFNKDYEFRHDGISITEISDKTVHKGSIVFGVPKRTITMKINKKEYKTIDPKLTYSDLQLLLTQNNASLAPRLMFYSVKDNNTKYHLPQRKYPTALVLHMMGELETTLLNPPMTVSSIDLYTPLTIELYDIGHNKIVKSNLWFKKNGTIGEMTKQLPGWFNYTEQADSKYYSIVSMKQEHGISRIFDEDQAIPTASLRVDLAKAPFPQTMKAMKHLIVEEESKFVAIEVRTVTFEEQWPHYRGMGIFVLGPSTTANSIAKLLFNSNVKPVACMIRSANDFYKGFQIEYHHNLISLLEQITDRRDWNNERPYLLFQMNQNNFGELSSI